MDPREAGPLRIGMLGQPKKFKQFFDSFIEYCNGSPVQCVCIDTDFQKKVLIDRNTGDTLGSLDVFFHKLSDEFATDDRNKENQLKVSIAEEYLKAHPKCFVFEAFPAVKLTTKRFRLLEEIDNCAALGSMQFGVPVTVLVDQDGRIVKSCGKTLTAEMRHVLRKTDVACGVPDTHDMAVAAVEVPLSVTEADAAIKDLVAAVTTSGWFPLLSIQNSGNVNDDGLRIVQGFLSNAVPVCLKCYIVGSEVNVRLVSTAPLMDHAMQARTGEPVEFCSHNKALMPALANVSFTARSCMPPALDDMSENARMGIKALAPFLDGCTATAREVILRAAEVASVLQRDVLGGMSLFGLDLLIGGVAVPSCGDASALSQRRDLFCIDVNYFPGFKGVTDVNEQVLVELRLRMADSSSSPAK